MVVTLQLLDRAIAADEGRDEVVGRVPEDLRRHVVLLEHAADVQDRDAIAHLHRFFDVVRDEHDGLLQIGLQPTEFVLQPRARDRVDGAERFVHQQHRRVRGERARDADALPLPTRELMRIAVAVLRGIEADEVEEFVDARPLPVLVPSEHLRHRRDVVFDRLVREQPDLLDHVADASTQMHRIDVRDVLVLDVDAAARRLDQPVDHAQQRRLPTSRGADEHRDLAVGDFQRQFAHRERAVRVPLADGFQTDHRRGLRRSHGPSQRLRAGHDAES